MPTDLDLYPEGPPAAPADLTVPTSRFQVHAWLAVFALLAFVALYISLTGWLGWVTFRVARDNLAFGGSPVGLVKVIPSAFVFVFLISGLFAVKRAENKTAIEIRPEEEPELFAFLVRIADEVGASRPHRVFLSPSVNAGVLYDLSLINLIFPTRKNLVVGLGLMSALDLGEIKAVMAHEFGHFAQKSMAVGRWVYVSEQIAHNIITTRGVFDKTLDEISRFDVYVGWLGSIMRFFVWSVRVVLDAAFSVVALAERALSREMELQADLVAVSLTGSDALIHALHKLSAADEAFDRAVGFAQDELAKGKVVEDLFAVQEHVLASVRRITSDETYGVAPAVPRREPQEHRVFPDRYAEPPDMWSTHPPNREREDNAKRVYVPCRLDARPAWALLRHPESRRVEMTRHLLARLNNIQQLPPDTLSTAEAIARVDEGFRRTHLDARYRGLYLGRRIMRNAITIDQIYEANAEAAAPTPVPTVRQLYPIAIVDELEAWRDLTREHATFKALKDGTLKPKGGLIRYRGTEVSRRDLSRIIAEVDREREAAFERIAARDRRCRTAHVLAARQLGAGWEAYLRSLAQLLHYAEHTEADVNDAWGSLIGVFGVVTATGEPSGPKRRRLIAAANEAYEALARPLRDRGAVRLPEAIAARMGTARFGERLGELTLEPPNDSNIGAWLPVAGEWLVAVQDDFASLRVYTLEVLLEAEEMVRRCLSGESEWAEAPAPASVPLSYTTILPGNERKREMRLGLWARLKLADGLFPNAARFTVALGVLSLGLLAGGTTLMRSIVVYNGLDTLVGVQVGDQQIALKPRSAREVYLGRSDMVRLVARNRAGAMIEELDADVSNSQSQYVYNIAAASPLVEWRAAYSSDGILLPYDPEYSPRGAPRITTTSATVLFRPPPFSGADEKYSTILVMDGVPTLGPKQMLSMVSDADDRARMIEAHVCYDDASSTFFTRWLAAARELPQGSEIIAACCRPGRCP